MATSFHSETAKIYEFPIRGRKTAADYQDRKSDLGLQKSYPIEFGGSWYHEEAIRETDQPRKS